jgi:hypothetical protein
MIVGLSAVVIALGIASLALRSGSEPLARSAHEVKTIAAHAPPVVALSKEGTAARVILHINADGAHLLVDGDALDATDASEPGIFVLDRPQHGEMRVVIAKAPGRVDRLLVIDGSTPATVEVRLVDEDPASRGVPASRSFTRPRPQARLAMCARSSSRSPQCP